MHAAITPVIGDCGGEFLRAARHLDSGGGWRDRDGNASLREDFGNEDETESEENCQSCNSCLPGCVEESYGHGSLLVREEASVHKDLRREPTVIRRGWMRSNCIERGWSCE